MRVEHRSFIEGEKVLEVGHVFTIEKRADRAFDVKLSVFLVATTTVLSKSHGISLWLRLNTHMFEVSAAG